MPITIPIYQQVVPQGDQLLQGFEAGSRAGEEIVQGQRQQKQFEEEIGFREQQLQALKQQQAVQQEVLKQRQALLTAQAAHQFQAQQDYQKAIQGGMDPTKAAMLYGPAMSGGRMTGYSPIFTGHEKAIMPPPAPIAPSPVPGPNGQPIGYSDKNGNVHYIPQPKADPGTFETQTDVFPGTKSTDPVPGTAAVAPEQHWWGGTSPGAPAQPGIPAVAGTPTRRVTKRIPIPMGPTAPDKGAAPAAVPAVPQALPLPSTKDALEEGKVYQTKYGPATWDGTQFTSQ